MVKRGIAASREIAAGLVKDSKVLVNGSLALKVSRQIRPSDQIILIEKPKYVSRGGLKLEGALSDFGVIVKGKRVLDAGSSTGGFTDCLLAFGADKVFAVDVGTNQLHERLRNHVKVLSFEKTNINEFVDPEGVGFDLVVADLSFISIRNLAAKLVELTRPNGELVVLVKPQFEVGHRDASKGKGIIKDPELWRDSLLKAAESFLGLNCVINAMSVSTIKGAQGNVEFFFYLSKCMVERYFDLENEVDLLISSIENKVGL